MSRFTILDPLHGEVTLSPEIEELAACPIVQRLRHVRLSNIDSIDSPGIAGISRYEHVVGVAHLASRISAPLGRQTGTILQAAALLHDLSITPYGHLVEEAIQYVDMFDHETHFLAEGDPVAGIDLGGQDTQFMGGLAGVKGWIERTFGATAADAEREIHEAIEGKGKFGALIKGKLDLDNLDNVVRIAFHMGLPCERSMPLSIASGVSGFTSDHLPIFSSRSIEQIQAWLKLREEVYTRLMLSRRDFVGKIMLLYATVRGLEQRESDASDWKETDFQFIYRLTSSNDREIRETASRWIRGDLWALSDLTWYQGTPPEYSKIREFSRCASEVLLRPVFAYRIKEKRYRSLKILTDSGPLELGEDRDQWLLGVGSPKGDSFSSSENATIVRLARDRLQATLVRGSQGELTLF